MKCECCGNYTYTRQYVEKFGKTVPICDDCVDKLKQEKIANKLQDVQKTEHFSGWSGEDMSKAFWMHLRIYEKYPNKRSLQVIKMAYYWACHADHGLAHCFINSMREKHINLAAEEKRKDLPEKYEEGENKT